MNRRISPPHYANSSTALKAMPPALLLLLTVLSMVELPLPFTHYTNPFLPLIGLFYFLLWQPRYLPIWTVLLAGLLYDSFQSTPLGAYALLFLCTRYYIIKMRTRTAFISSPWLAWLRFLWVGTVFFLLEWAFISALEYRNIYSAQLCWRDILTLLLYPLMHGLFSSLISGMQRRF